MSDYAIRQSVPFDLDAILKIERANPPAAHWSEDAYRQLWGDPAASRIGFVAESEGRILGFVVAHEIVDEWELENIAVAPEAQRQGIAAALVQHLVEVLQRSEGKRLLLEVRESNAAARALYDGQGFAVSGRRRNYYSNPSEDALLFEKKIGNPGMKIH